MKPGCLGAILKPLTGSPKQLPIKRLPELPTDDIHRTDLPELVKVRNAARSAFEVLQADGGSAAAQLSSELAKLVGSIYDLGRQINKARDFLQSNSPDQVQRDKAELELEMIGGTVERVREIKKAMALLDERVTHGVEVEKALDKLTARLLSSSAEVEAFSSRLRSELGNEELEHELRAYARSAELSVEAYLATMKELEE